MLKRWANVLKPCQTRLGQILLGITLLGFVLRILGLNFGLPNDSRPDEIPILQVVLGLLLTPIFKNGDWQLHPHFLNYPSLYFYIQSVIFSAFYGIGLLLGWFTDWRNFMTNWNSDPTAFHLILRWFNAIIGTVAIPGMALLARQWCSRSSIIIMAALFSATNYLLVRNSHFGSVDMLMLLGVVLSLWAILRYQSQRTEKTLWQACILIGLTVGTKYPAALLLLPLWVVLLEPAVSRERIEWSRFFHSIWKPTGLTFIVFFVTSPWILLDFPEFLHDFQYEAHYFFNFRTLGIETGWLFYPSFALWYGIGAFVLFLFLLGVYCRLRQSPNRWTDASLLSFLIGFFCLLGFNERVMTRYALPMVPVILLYAAYGAVYGGQLLQQLLKPKPKWGQYLIWASLGIGALAQPLMLSSGFDQHLMQADTRTLARNWILQNVPPQTPIATGPRLGMISLPLEYGQLVVETGPQFMMPPEKFALKVISPHMASVNTYADLEALKKLGIRYVVTFNGMPAYGNREWEMNVLLHQARLVFYVNPLKPKTPMDAVGRFDPLDAFYLPYANLDAFERPGPIIAIFDLAQPPAEVPGISGAQAPVQ